MLPGNKFAEDNDTGQMFGTGWLSPFPDMRDLTVDRPEIAAIAKTLKLSFKAALPTSVDLRQWCSPIEDQKQLGSCTANASVGIVEYFERRAFNKHTDGSRLFVYKTTRNLMGVTGDTGAWLRNAMGALAILGVPPEKYWPYTDKKQPTDPNDRYFDTEPPAFVYALADNFEAMKYFCHDPQGHNIAPNKVVDTIKTYLANGIPSMFGFYGFNSFNSSDVPGGIPFPCSGEKAQWGHAIVAVGFDDNKKITNTQCNKATTGALLIRNSWGTSWGDKGYGWLPYDYILNKIAMDFWSLISMEWINTNQFGLD